MERPLAAVPVPDPAAAQAGDPGRPHVPDRRLPQGLRDHLRDDRRRPAAGDPTESVQILAYREAFKALNMSLSMTTMVVFSAFALVVLIDLPAAHPGR